MLLHSRTHSTRHDGMHFAQAAQHPKVLSFGAGTFRKAWTTSARRHHQLSLHQRSQCPYSETRAARSTQETGSQAHLVVTDRSSGIGASRMEFPKLLRLKVAIAAVPSATFAANVLNPTQKDPAPRSVSRNVNRVATSEHTMMLTCSW